MNHDRASLAQILDRIELALEFAGGDKDRFMKTRIAQEAVIRELEVIGEAAKRVSPGTRAHSADVPWKSLTGFKNIAIHQYDAIDLDRVWKLVHVELPQIRIRVKAALADLKEE